MGDVEDFHHAVDQREAHRNDEQPGRVDQPVDQDGEQVIHGELIQRHYHFPACMPALIQSRLFMPSGGCTRSRG